jgi:endo-1,4-beta-xylanase
MKMHLLFATILLLTGACKKENNPSPLPPISSPESAETLKGTAPFPMGVSIDTRLLKSNQACRNRILKEHNSLSAENIMKWHALHPEEKRFDFAEADELVAFAQANQLRVFGHTLLWHSSTPGWVNNYFGDAAAWENLVKTHIQTVIAHFKGKVQAWDVVNEAFNEQGALRKGYTTDDSIWAEKLGPDYLARLYQYAAAVDPNALLFYNDYGQEASPAKTKAILDMVADFKKRGVPIHGLGLQMHVGLNTNQAAIENVIKAYAETGLKVHISELDVAISNYQKNSNLKFTEALAQEQREKYRQIVAAYRRLVPPAQQFGITTWNVGDGDSWLRRFIQPNEWPLPFDENYLRKPAYFGILAGLKE